MLNGIGASFILRNSFRAKRSPLAKGGRTVQVRGVLQKDGILPIAKSSRFGDWRLPGSGEKYGDCGRWYYRGCLHAHLHVDSTLDSSNVPGMAYVRRFARTCYRAECPICSDSWANKEAEKVEYRLKGYRGKWRKVVHCSVSPPPQVYEDPLNLSRKKAYKLLKKCGLTGGTLIFHPFRYDSRKEVWYVSPHYHALGYGWIHSTDRVYRETGWVVKNHGIRKSVRWTAWYQLNHAGIKKGSHTLTWFGSCSYNILKLDPKPKPEEEICPYCGHALQSIKWIGDKEPPDLDVFFAPLSDLCLRPKSFY